MNMRDSGLAMRLSFVLLLVLIVSVTVVAQEIPKVGIGVIVDGPNQEFLAELGTILREEILSLTRGEFDVSFDPVITADWTMEGAVKAYKQLVNNPDVDIIITLGPLGSAAAGRQEELPKPVVAPLIVNPQDIGVPFENGTSGKKNLSYVTSITNLAEDLRLFRSLVGFEKLALVIPKVAIEGIPELLQTLDRHLEVLDIEVVIVPGVSTAEGILTSIPGDADAVYQTIQVNLPEAERRKLYQEYIRRQLPSFVDGRKDVELGGLMTLRPSTDNARLARRVALNVQRILLGEDPANFDVTFAVGQSLAINLNTALNIEYYPDFPTLNEAVLIDAEPQQMSRTYSLSFVMDEAIKVNLDVVAQELAVAVGKEDISQAKAVLFPQVDASATGTIIDEDRAAASNGSAPQRALNAAVSISQLVYSERAFANIYIQSRLQDSRTVDLEIIKLDIAAAAATAYLNYLRAENFLTIRRDNLRVTRSNLDRARIREEVGISGRSDVYRWQSQLATAKLDVNEAEESLNLARIQMNRILNRPLEEGFAAEPFSLEDEALVTRDEKVYRFTNNPWAFKVFREYLTKYGLENSPELRGLDLAIDAQKRAIDSAEVAFYSPTIGLQAEISQKLASGGEGSEPSEPIPGFQFPTADDTNWNIGLNISLPLFSGGERFSAVRQTTQELARLHKVRASTVEKIGQSIRSATHSAGRAAASINLTAEAAEAARKNLELVTDGYSRGVVNIIDLLDAQNAALVAELSAVDATYGFALSIIDVDRSLGTFAAFRSPEERESFLIELEDYFKQVGMPTTLNPASIPNQE